MSDAAGNQRDMSATLPSAAVAGADPFAGRYRVLRPLGRGTFKDVYLAHDERLDRDVALALVAGAGGERPAARVQREMRVTGRLGDHPNVVTIHDAGEHEGITYLVLRPMLGGSLASALERSPGRRLPVAEAVRIGGQVALGLAHAHSHGVVHRDVKPDNVWLDPDGGAALGDFGVALTSEGARLTLDQGVVGTVLYLAPEQADGRGAVPASDLYALGVTLYELICGRTPFAGDDALTVISQHLSTPPVAPSGHVPDIPEALDRLIVALLAKAPAERPPDAAAVAAELAQVAGRPAVAPAPAPLSRLAPGAFVGREAELALARSACEDALRGHGRILALAGEAGSGKSRCLDELMTFARLRGARCVTGACLEDEGAPPLWPWRQVLGALGAEAYLAEEHGAAERDEVEARFRLFDAIAGELRASAASAPLVVRLEDLHWADRSSLALLGHLAASLDDAAILVAVTYRSEGLRRGTPLADLIGRLGTSPAFAEAQLAGFDRAELARYVELTTGMSAGASAVDAILARTGGNPFFVAETVRMLAAEGRLTAADRAGVELEQLVPPRVQAVLARRLDRLPAGVGGLLAVAAVLGLEFAAAEAARFGGVDRGAALDALETATAERLVEPVAGRPGRFAFVHSTVRDVLYAGLAVAERTRLHAAVADGLAASPRAAARTAEIAHHAVIAARGGAAAEPAVAASVEAARQATAIHAHAEAAEHLDRALEVADLAESADGAQRCELLLAAAHARSSAGDLEQGRERAGEAADLARAIADDEAFVRAALAFSEWQLYGSHDAPAVALLEEALERAQAHAPATRATLLGRLAVRLDPADDQARRERLLDEAIALARAVGEPYALSRLLALSPLVRWRPGDRPRRRADAAETIALVRSGGDREAALWAHIMRYVDVLERGEMEEARLELEAYGRLAGRLRQPYYRWYLTVLQATRALFDGELDEGARLAAEAVAYNRAHEPDSEQEFTVQSIMLARLRSRPEDVDVERLRGFADDYDDIPLWRALLAAVEADRGNADGARRAYRTCLRDGVGALREDADLPGTLAALAHAAVGAGEREHRDGLYERLLPFADRNVLTDRGWAAWGPAALPLARLAAAAGRADRARGHFERAIELDRAWGARPWLAHAVADYLESAAPPAERAEPLRAEALEIAAELGLDRLARRLRG